LLYLHRLLVKAGEALTRLLASTTSVKQLPVCLLNLHERLREYRTDEEIQRAAAMYEKAHEVFRQLRQALRRGGAGKPPLSESYALGPAEQGEVKKQLKDLCVRWREAGERSGLEEKKMYEIVLTHVERYEDKLFYEGAEKLNEEEARTTNALERGWRKAKRRCRCRHGRAELKKDMQCLPAEALLVGNLEIPEYVAVVLGSLEELPHRLAEVGGQESFRSWKAREQPRQVGQMPRCFLRQFDFLDRLLEVCPALDDSPWHKSCRSAQPNFGAIETSSVGAERSFVAWLTASSIE
jgi:hypothetical protein